MTVFEALQIIQLLAPAIQQAINNGQTTISAADLDAAAAALNSDITALEALIAAKKAAGQ